jgi:PBSX family phage terminase large subunit
MVNTSKNKHKHTGRKLVHVYRPRGGCKEVFDSREEEVLVSGPAGTGKSRACLEKIFAMCLATPNSKALILRKTLSSLADSALATWRKFVIAEAQATGTVVYYGGSREEPPQYRFKNGSKVIIGGLDKASRIMSTEYDIVYVQEATEITLDDLESLKTRLRNWAISFQQLLMDCNPAGDKHWLKLRCDDKICKLIESRHEDNPVLFNEDGSMTTKGVAYIEGILDKLTGVRYKRLRLGLWVSAEGIIYEEFDPAIHVLPWQFDAAGERLPLPNDWPRYWLIDFGFTNPFVWQCWAQDPEDGAVYLYREIYHTQRTVEQHCQQIMDIVAPETTRSYWDHINRVRRTITERKWIEPMPTMVITDHDAEGRRTFEHKTGLGTQPAIKKVYEGINLVKERMTLDTNGYARIYFMADCLVERDQSLVDRLLPTCTKDETSSYIWKVNADGRIQDEPVKKDDHGMDDMRYLITELDYLGQARYSELPA